MTEQKKGKEIFRPYARLISVLGDQLISDKWIGIIELVKNSYDADAENVFVRFYNFDNPTEDLPATIEIEDDGEGMTLQVIKDIWMKPATPNKLNKKKSGDLRFTTKGRVMQGDKGVGRFAVYKLGNYIEVFTKTAESNEVKLTLDFTNYAHDEFVETNHEDKFLDEMYNQWEENDIPLKITNKKKQGTIIRITSQRNTWKKSDLEKLAKAFFRMMPPTLPGVDSVKQEFKVELTWDNEQYQTSFLTFEQIAEMAPFYFEGTLDKEGRLDFSYKHNKKIKALSFNLFDDNELVSKYGIRSLRLFKDQFIVYADDKKTIKKINKPQVGGFMFFFYAFDWKNPIEGLKDDEKKFLQENTVYLYRDNIRVYPYGERGVDWLMLSKLRAEDRAGSYFSYNDLIGFIFITQSENPKLRDAADREGLMNIDGAYDDFIALIQACLKVMKDHVEIDKIKKQLEKEKVLKTFNQVFEDAFKKLQNKVLEIDDKDLLDRSQKLFRATNNLVQKVREDLKITQELAGTGMVIEKATHDTFSLLKKLKTNTNDFVQKFEKGALTTKELKEFLIEIRDNLEFLYQELQVIQPLLRVARKITRDVSVKDIAERIQKYFRKEIENINVEIEVSTDIIVKTNTGLVLQVLLNLMDNAIYWVNEKKSKTKKITIFIDGLNHRLIFADNGLGIDSEIKDVVFTEFYSTKEEGRGLGLYIVKELLERIDASISVITENNLKILEGANFLIQFHP